MILLHKQHNNEELLKLDLEVFNMTLKEEILDLQVEQELLHMNLIYNKHNLCCLQHLTNNICLHINKTLLIQLYLSMIDKLKEV
ncbi:MAG: hypothetical protein EBR82_29570 [Caulobacteraceae bacterium]|nr:hypothetical protein [Caulobacteraceae bacterium]